MVYNYYPLMVIFGMVYYCFTNITSFEHCSDNISCLLVTPPRRWKVFGFLAAETDHRRDETGLKPGLKMRYPSSILICIID